MRKPKHQLELRAIPGTDLFRLSGYCLGKRIRKQSKSFETLDNLKQELEKSAQVNVSMTEDVNSVPTWLTKAQVRDAEAAFRLLIDRPYTLLECVNAATATLGTGKPVACSEAVRLWVEDMEKRRRQSVTIREANRSIKKFLGITDQRPAGNIPTVGEIGMPHIEGYVFEKHIGATTQSNRATLVRSFLNFCMDRQWLRASPFKINITQLKEAGTAEREKIRTLTPEQCEALLKAAIGYRDGIMVPYFILSIWCFMRPSEVARCVHEDITFVEENLVEVNKHKKGRGYRHVTIPANMVPLLKECMKREFFGPGCKVPFSPYMFDDVRELAGVIKREPYNEGASRNIISSLWQGDIMRHTGISFLFKTSGSIDNATRQAGNSPQVAFAHYVRLQTAENARAFYRITGRLAPVQEEERISA